MSSNISRRQFIKGTVAAGATAVLVGCQIPPKEPPPTQVPATVAQPDTVATQDPSNRNLEQIARLSNTKVNTRGWHQQIAYVTNTKTFNDQLFDKKMEELTNVHIAWQTSGGDDPLSLIIASGDIPDVVAIYSTSGMAKFVEYGQKGAFANVGDLIDRNPYLSGILQKNPRYRGSVVAPDGKIYFWPSLFEGPANYTTGFFIRKDWLAEVNLPVPDTMEQWLETLRAFKKQDAKRYPVTLNPGWIIHQWGVGATAQLCHHNWYHEGNTVKYGPIQPQYREALLFINQLFKEGLLDPDYEQINWVTDREFQKLATGVAGSGQANAGSLDGAVKIDPSLADKFLPAEAPKGPYGHRGFLGMDTVISGARGTAQAANSKHLEIMGRYMDLYYSTSGSTLYYWGIYGDTYTEQNGKKVWADKVVKDPKMSRSVYIENLVSPRYIGAGRYPVWPEDLVESDYRSKVMLVWYKCARPTIELPPRYLTPAETKVINETMTDIDTLVAENRAAFINGTRNLDKGFNDMVAQIKSLGIDRATEAYQASYDRWRSAANS